jgi:ABC-2 type transport system permease protein
MYVLMNVIRKELLQLRRDKKMIPIIFVAPVVQLLALGYAANLDVTDIPTVLVDQDRSSASRALVDRFVASGYFELVATEETAAAVEPWLVTGRARLALVVGEGYGEAVAAGTTTPRVQVLADGSDSSAAGIGLGHASRIVSEASAELVAARLREMAGMLAASGRPPPRAGGTIEPVPRVWYNPDLLSRWFFVPAVLALVLMVMTMVLSSMGIVREKEIGTMEQLIVTPIRPWQLIVGKLLPYAAIGTIDVFLVLGIAVGWFGVPLRGSLALLVALTMLLLLNTLGLGLLTSTVVRTQQQAMMTAVFVLMIPQIYLSGLIFPIENMPEGFQEVTYAVPLRYYAEILRAIFLKGAGMGTLWPQASALAAFGVGFLVLASLRFRKRLD